jgi:hypothetical protein
MAPHKLHNTWVIWEIKEKQGNADVRSVPLFLSRLSAGHHSRCHCMQAKDYGNLVREVCEFSSVEEFWKYWMYLPKPRYWVCMDVRYCAG